MNSGLFKRQWLMAPAILLVGMTITYYISQPKAAAPVATVEERLQQIHVTVLEPRSINVPILTQGNVEPRTKVKLVSEVNGKVIETASRWYNGGFFRKGDLLLRVEDFYYQNQLARAKANQSQAKSALAQEEGFSYVARQEWEKRNTEDSSSAAAKSLALREPQREAIQAQYAAASADVVAAEHGLGQTTIRAPFDGLIVNKLVDIGQYVSPGVAVADILAIDVAEVRVALTEAQQAFLDLPALNQTSRIPAIVHYKTPEGDATWKGQLVRTEGVLDPISKVLNGVVIIRDPYGLNKAVKSPLRLGTFVEVELQGKRMENIFVIPRRFLYTGNVVWLVDQENKLRSRKVSILPIRDEQVYVYEGLKAGEKLVSGGVVGLIDGKIVSPVVDDGDKPAREEKDAR